MTARWTLTTILALATGPAVAHPGHLGELAGHSHWIALGLGALAGSIALWAGLKGCKSDDTTDADSEEQQEEEATA